MAEGGVPEPNIESLQTEDQPVEFADDGPKIVYPSGKLAAVTH